MSKKKVLFFVQLPPPTHGASTMNNFVFSYFSRLQNWKVGLVEMRFSNRISELERFSIQKILKFPLILFKLFFSLVSSKPDLIYFSFCPRGFAQIRDIFFVLILNLLGLNVLIHIHHYSGLSRRENNHLVRRLQRMAFRDSSIILLSRLFFPLLNDLPSKSVFIVPNGVPDQDLKADKQILKSGNRARILWVSNLISYKGVLVLVEALALLANKGVAFEAEFVGADGDISVASLKKQVAELGLSSKIFIVGPKYGIEKEQAFQNADIFAFPTSYDAFPLVIIEAMAANLPVVSTIEGAIPDIIDNGRTGWIVPPKSPHALAEKLEWLINNPEERKKMGQTGRDKFKREYSLETFQTRMVYAFESSILR